LLLHIIARRLRGHTPGFGLLGDSTNAGQN
jgi:hypothetical protein